MIRRFLGVTFVLLLAMVGVAQQKTTSLPPLALKEPLGAVPLPSASSTKDLLRLVEDATAKGRAAFQASLRFDESYRSFLGVLREGQRQGEAVKLCASPMAAKAYLSARQYRQEFQASRAEFEALLPPLVKAKGNDTLLTPERQRQIARMLAYQEDAKGVAASIEALFSSQIESEMLAAGCDEKSLQKVAAEPPSKPKKVQPVAKATPNTPGILPPAQLGNVPFTINNVDCQTPFVVVLDGKPIGTASANAVSSWSAKAGWHSLCLAADGDPDLCNTQSSGVRVYLYEGWWVRAQCPLR